MIKQLLKNSTLICLSFLMFSCGGSKKVVSHDTLTDFERKITLTEAIDMAEEENKLVMLNLYTDWCLPCKMMDQNVFNNQETANFVEENFIPYKVNAEENNGPNLAFLYEVKSFPGIVFLDNRGRVVEKYEGAMSNTKFKALAKRALGSQSVGMYE